MAATLVTIAFTGIAHAASVPKPPHLPQNTTNFSLNTSDACDNLRNCRTMWSLVYGCLLTIFACVWTAVHPKVPQATWDAQSSRISMAVAAFLAPEATLGVAWREFRAAWRISKSCQGIEGARTILMFIALIQMKPDLFIFPQGWTHTHSYFVVMNGFFDTSEQKSVIPGKDDEPSAFLEQYAGIIEKSGDRRRAVTTRDEILDRSKGDLFAKSIVVTQLLWFVAQYIGRWAAHLHRSQLEAMTLAYAVLSILVYILWWDKPLNIRFPVRVTKETRPDATTAPSPEAKVEQDTPKVENQPDSTPPPAKTMGSKQQYFVFIMTAIIFGGIHCFAWSFLFQTHVEMLLWRISAIIITVCPIPITVSFGLMEYYDSDIVAACGTLALMTYTVARLILFTLTFTSLRLPPPDLYQTVPSCRILDKCLYRVCQIIQAGRII
jgi:hypothetical protein